MLFERENEKTTTNREKRFVKHESGKADKGLVSRIHTCSDTLKFNNKKTAQFFKCEKVGTEHLKMYSKSFISY